MIEPIKTPRERPLHRDSGPKVRDEVAGGPKFTALSSATGARRVPVSGLGGSDEPSPGDPADPTRASTRPASPRPRSTTASPGSCRRGVRRAGCRLERQLSPSNRTSQRDDGVTCRAMAGVTREPFDAVDECNEFGQPIGVPVPDVTYEAPKQQLFRGAFCEVVPLSAESHADGLFKAFGRHGTSADWTYLPYGPFNREEFARWAREAEGMKDPCFYAVVDANDGSALGVTSLMRADLTSGCIEIGHVHYSRELQHTPAATEATYLLARHVFDDLGYRRLEWKCDSLNRRSRRAAERLGFEFEGVFRQHKVCKGRNRDTAWYSIIDREWPRHRAALCGWLAHDNFDTTGRQVRALAAFRE